MHIQERRQRDAKHLGAVELLGQGLDDKLVQRWIGRATAIRSTATAASAFDRAGYQLPGPGRRVHDAVGNETAMLADIDESRNRHWLLSAAIQIAHHVA